MINAELKIINYTSNTTLNLSKILYKILPVLFISLAFNTFANPKDQVKTANDFYANGKYEDAIVTYQEILDADNISTDIYYNLGNCFYKTRNLPNAILNYEKALKLKPDNEDALFNLAMANQLTVDKIDRLPELFIGNTWRNLITSKTIDNWAFYTAGLIYLSLLFFVAYLLMQQVIIKKVNFYAGVFFLSLSLFTFLMAAQHYGIVQQSSEAIIFAPTITIQSEPNNNSESLFTLHEGTKVTLLEVSNEWSKIKLPNGNIGWIKSTNIEKI